MPSLPRKERNERPNKMRIVILEKRMMSSIATVLVNVSDMTLSRSY